MKSRRVGIQVDGYVDRQHLFDIVLEKMNDIFVCKVTGDFQEGRSFFGMWQMTFAIDEKEHTDENHEKVNALLRYIYEKGKTGVRGFRTVWEEDRHQRMVEEAESDIERFGSISFNLDEKWVKNMQEKSEKDD